MSARPVPDAPPPRAVIKRFLLLGPLVGWAVVALGFVFLTTALTGSRFGSPVEGLVSGLLLVTVFGLPLAYLQGGIPAILTGVVVSRWDGQMPRRRYVARAAGVGALIAAAVSSAPALLYAASRLLQGRHADLMNIPPAAAGAAALGGLAAAVCAWSLRRPTGPIPSGPSPQRTGRRQQGWIVVTLVLAATAMIVGPALLGGREMSPNERRNGEMARQVAETRRRDNEALARLIRWQKARPAPRLGPSICREATLEERAVHPNNRVRCRFTFVTEGPAWDEWRNSRPGRNPKVQQ